LDIRKKIQEIKLYLRITRANRIARRYFIMNSFDGIVTILGVITGSFVSNVYDPNIIIGIGLSTAIAMGISGISGTFMAEKTERDIEISELEASMLSDLKNTIYAKAVRFTVVYVSLVDALSPIIASLITLLPIILSYIGFLPNLTGIYLSEALAFIYLFTLGSAMAHMIKKNMILEGGKMMLVGLLTAIIIIFIFRF
jgi:predicted membrane protein (TIGR00267 family)